MNAVICILCAVIVLQSVLHFAERRDLYNRLMCRNLSEYKSGDAPKKVKSIHTKLLGNWRSAGKDGDK